MFVAFAKARARVVADNRNPGNQAILPLALRGARIWNGPAPGTDHAQEHKNTSSNAGICWNFTKIPVFSPDRQPSFPPLLQPKLAIGTVNDPLEYEADRVADQVMRMPEPDFSNAAAPSQLSEPRFGHDFSKVRIHANARAADSASAVGAFAYTVGSNIAFAPARFAPSRAPRRLLLAHELAHVVQQWGASDPGTLKPQADTVADQVMRTEDHRVWIGDASQRTAAPAEKIFRQTTAIPGVPGGPDPCLTLLEVIVELLNELAQRFNDALNDRHDLFRYHREVKDAHPDYGSWEGHRNRYNYDRDRLRQKLAEWESNDNCRGFPLSKQQQEDLAEAEEFKEKEFPEKPAPAMRQAEEEAAREPQPSLRERVAEGLRQAGIPAWAVAGLVVLIIAALADPEPFSKVALIIGAAAATVLLIYIGRSSDVPGADATASISDTGAEDHNVFGDEVASDDALA